MKTVNFLTAGRMRPNETIFFTSEHRRDAKIAAQTLTVYHRNRYTSIWRIPVSVFRAMFVFDRSTGIYRTIGRRTYGDIALYLVEMDHEAKMESEENS